MKRWTPTSQELDAHAMAVLGETTPEQRDVWLKSPVTTGAFLIIERIRMDCIEQAELLPDSDSVSVLMAQAQILTRLAEEFSETITETAEYEQETENTSTEDDADSSRPSPRHRAHFTP